MQLSANTLDLPLSDVLQVLQRKHRTCQLRLTDGLVEGEIFLEYGEITHAWFGELRGGVALSTLLAAPELTYDVSDESTPGLRTIERPLPELLRAAAHAAETKSLPDPMHGVTVAPRPSIGTSFVERERVGVVSMLSVLVVGAVISLGILWDAFAHGSDRGSESASGPDSAQGASAQRAAASDERSRAAYEISVKGSDTIGGALFPAWARAFEASHTRARVRVEALGSATAFSGLFDGSASIGASSRLVRPDELALAKRLNITLHEIVAGYDGIGVIVHPSNPLSSLDLDTVAAIFSGKATHWRGMGGQNLPIRAIGRPSYSGTHGFFRDQVLSRLGKDTAFGAQVEAIEASQEIVERVANDPTAIAYVSLGWVRPTVRTLALAAAPSMPPIKPEPEYVRRGDYPISRPLLLYLRSDASKQVRELATFAVSAQGQQLVAANGFVPVGAPVTLPAWGPVSPASHGALARLVRVGFEPGSARLDPPATQILRDLAPDLRQRARAIIIGNADSEGAAHVIQRLSQRRAEAVADYLQSLDIEADAISVEVAAADHPVATNQTSAGRSENRRVDIFVVPRQR